MVVVFGSINLDLVTRVPRLPSPGETLIGSGFASYPGGKGANQALAAARAGAVVRMYGAVGRDAAAASALALLRAGGVDVAGIRAVDAPTGCATILVDDAGENAIVVVPGANESVDADAVPDAVLAPRAVLLLQHEVPPSANAALVARAARPGTRIVLNAAPARPLNCRLLATIATLIVNETEAAALATAVRLAGRKPGRSPPRQRRRSTASKSSSPGVRPVPISVIRQRSRFTSAAPNRPGHRHDRRRRRVRRRVRRRH